MSDDQTDELSAALEAAGRELAAADEQRDRALDAVRAALEAADGKVPLARAARLAGVSRVTAYRLLGRSTV